MFFSIKNKNNNEKYEIRPGFSITSNYNETLDSANIVISQLGLFETMNIEPFDECEIISDYALEGFSFDNTDKKYHLYMCVDSYQKKQLSVGYSAYFEYSISLFSQTKLLEGIILPSLKITRGATPRKIYRNGTGLKDWGYLDEYLREYGSKHRTTTMATPHNPSQVIFKQDWDFSQRVKDRFSKIDCPEMQWNQPTLRQVLTDLMMVDDCIPVLRNGVIDYIDVSKAKQKVIETDENQIPLINYVQQSQSSADYVSELRVNAKNITQKQNDTVRDYTQICEKIGFRNNGTGILNDQNIKLETTYPIYDLLSLKMELWCKGEEKDTGVSYSFYGSRDLVKDGLCVEKGVYDTKDIWYKEFGTNIDYHGDLSPYQNFNVYYTRGGKSIEGWNVLTNKAFLVSDKIRTLDILANYIAKDYLSYEIVPKPDEEGNTPLYASVIFANSGLANIPITNWDGVFFEIKYKTTADALFQISKEKDATNNRVVVDNQSSSYVDIDAQGFLEYMKANRLGNKMLMINARYENKDFDKIANLGDTYNKNIIFKKTISVFDDYIMANYYATENYVLRDYFTGVKAKQRSWKIVDGSEALERHDLIKCYIELSSKKAQEVSRGVIMPISSNETPIENNVFSLFVRKDDEGTNRQMNFPISGSLVNFIAKDSVKLPNYKDYKYYQSELIVRKVGNSIVFTTGATDNIYFGRYIRGKTTGGYAQTPLAYADSDGENLGGTIYYSNKIEPINVYDGGSWEDITHYAFIYTPSNFAPIDKTKDVSRVKPLASYGQFQGTIKFQLSYDFYKDNSEISKISLQFEYCTDKNDNIVIGKKFVELQEFITSESNYSPSSYKMYTSNTKPTQAYNEIIPDDAKLVDRDKWSATVIDNSVLFKASTSGKYAYITDLYNRVIIAFANRTTGSSIQAKIYANLLSSRNKNIYDATGKKTGSIYN